MHENRNASVCNQGQSVNNAQPPCNGTVCIDTKRVFDSCRDRDCFEDVRVYLTRTSEDIIATTTNLRTRTARFLWAYVGVDEIPFNCGFYQITVRYYIEVEFEACIGVGRGTVLRGLAALEKNVVLYGGEGRAVTFSSDPENAYCSACDMNNRGTNAPVAVVETVEPIVLGTKVNDCNCNCACTCVDYPDIPSGVIECLGEEIVINSTGPKVYVSFGLFSVVRIERPTQILVNATDYSVPDKECTAATNNDNPCSLFRNIAFPTGQFRGSENCAENPMPHISGCGCKRN